MSATGERLLGLKRHLRAVIVPDEAAYLVSPRGVIVLRGEHMEVLLPLLDGSRTLEAVVRETAPALRADRVGALLGRLVDDDATLADDDDAVADELDVARVVRGEQDRLAVIAVSVDDSIDEPHVAAASVARAIASTKNNRAFLALAEAAAARDLDRDPGLRGEQQIQVRRSPRRAR